jgi:hypothetical protein
LSISESEGQQEKSGRGLHLGIPEDEKTKAKFLQFMFKFSFKNVLLSAIGRYLAFRPLDSNLGWNEAVKEAMLANLSKEWKADPIEIIFSDIETFNDFLKRENPSLTVEQSKNLLEQVSILHDLVKHLKKGKAKTK